MSKQTKQGRSPNQSLAIILAVFVACMLGMAFAAVPLYKIFCQKTGYGGTPKIAKTASKKTVAGRLLTVRFTASCHRDMPLHFKPQQTSVTVKIGENGLAFYEAENISKLPVKGMATYNVTPDKAGQYFNKIACFCFEEQQFIPGKVLDMPVQFFIDPEFLKDPNVQDVDTITLSYTFFRLD